MRSRLGNRRIVLTFSALGPPHSSVLLPAQAMLQSEAAMGAPPLVIAVLQSATHRESEQVRTSTDDRRENGRRLLTALVSELHAGKGEVCSEARFRASLNGEVARDVDASREHARVDRVAADRDNTRQRSQLVQNAQFAEKLT